MALRTILEEGEATLRKKARPVTVFDERLRVLAEDMLETMKDDQGVGLAAPQVGILKRMFVMNTEEEMGDVVLVNPRILSTEGTQKCAEGCLSLPGLYGYVQRPEKLTVAYQDLQGEEHEMTVEGLTAICVCHESDHLDGILFRDKVEGSLFRYNEEGEPVPEERHP